MFPFGPRQRPRHVLRLLALLTGFFGGTVRAKVTDYTTDPTLSVTTVNVGKHNLRPVSLAEIFTVIETETSLKLAYPPGTFSLGESIVLETDGVISLAQLFGMVSAQKDLEFVRDGVEIAVRVAKAADGDRGRQAYVANIAAASSRPAPEPVLRVAAPTVAFNPPTAGAGAAAGELAAAVGEIAGDNQSRSRREKRIGAAVSASVTAATAGLEAKVDVLEVAAELVGAAAGAAPSFVDTIANAAAFAAPIKGIKGAAARLRSAAFSGARSPKGAMTAARSPAAPRPDYAPSAGRPEVIRVPVGQTPDSFFPRPAAEPAPSEPSPSAAVSDRNSGNLFSSGSETSTSAVSSVSAPTSTASASFGSESAAPTLGPINAAPIELPSAGPTVGADGVIKMEKFGVEGTVARGSNRDLRAERVKATASIDFMGADQLAKFGASDLSDVVFRIPGVSVVGGQFAVVRGLSDRFLSTTLHGVKIPSPDPEKQAVQLDLLPASAVEAVVVAKTFQPGQWAESSGGNMDVRTRTIPSEGQLRFTVGLKLNANAADGGPDYAIRGSTAERFGFGSRSRLAVGTNDPTWQYVPTYRSSFPIGNKLGVEFAREFNFGEQRLGLLVSAFNEASYRAKSGRRSPRLGAKGVAARAATSTQPAFAGSPSDFEKTKRVPSVLEPIYLFAESESEYVTGLTLASGFRFSAEHEIKLAGIFVQSGIDQIQSNETESVLNPVTKIPQLVGPNPNNNIDPTYSWFKTYQYFRERNLTVLQLSGQHKFPSVGNLGVTWAAQRGTSYQKDHPFLENIFLSPLADLYKKYEVRLGSDAPTPIFAVWADNQETQNAGRLDFSLPFGWWTREDATVKFGGALDSSGRDVEGFGRFTSSGTIQPSPLLISSDPNQPISYSARSVGGVFATTSVATRKIKAYYAEAILPLYSQLKLTGGARFEDFSLNVDGIGRWGNFTSTTIYTNGPGGYGQILGTQATGNPPLESSKWYPTVGLIYDFDKKYVVRLTASETNGRPSFREVSPFFNKSIETGNLVIGNPALKPSEVTSYDARFEWVPSRTTSLSFSYFQKKILNPVEKMVVDTRGGTSEFTELFLNNPAEADLRGFEFEFRHSFSEWSEVLREFSVSGNFTSIDAEVAENSLVVRQQSPQFQNPSNVALKRRLFDQPEYIGNLELTWAHASTGTSATVSAFAISDTLSLLGLGSFNFDLYERSHTRYDFIFNQRLSSRLKLKLNVKNFTDPVRGTIYDREATTELVVRNEYKAGREFGVSVTAEF